MLLHFPYNNDIRRATPFKAQTWITHSEDDRQHSPLEKSSKCPLGKGTGYQQPACPFPHQHEFVCPKDMFFWVGKT